MAFIKPDKRSTSTLQARVDHGVQERLDRFCIEHNHRKGVLIERAIIAYLDMLEAAASQPLQKSNASPVLKDGYRFPPAPVQPESLNPVAVKTDQYKNDSHAIDPADFDFSYDGQ